MVGKWIFLLGTLLISTSCIHVQRSSESGYAGQALSGPPLPQRLPSSVAPSFRGNPQDINKILVAQGMNVEDLDSSEGQEKLQKALRVKQLESYLADDRERRQYYKNLPWLKNDEEKIEFLQQNGYLARQLWLQKAGIGKRPVEIDPAYEDLIAAQDIAIGMPNELVRRSWGPPDSMDVAGNPIYGNERWKYKRYTPSPEGYRLQSKIIYFESGKVAGWEQVDP